MMISGAQLRAARGFLDWTREECASAADVSPETIKNIEHGTFRPNRTTIAKILEAFRANGLRITDDGVEKIAICPRCSAIIS